jgi:nucleoid-associated protein YgaU
VVKRAHWVVLAPTVALGALCDPTLAQDAKPDDPVRRHAEELAEEASKKFGEVLKEQTPEAKPKPLSPVNAADRERSIPLLLYWLDYSEHEYRGILRRLALEGAEKGWDPATVGWLKRSSQEFQAIMQRLARAGVPASKWDPVAEAHVRAGRDQGRAEEGSARAGVPAGTPSATGPGAAVEPGAAVAGIGPPTGQAETAGGPTRAEAETTTRLPAGDGRAALKAPPNADPGPGAIAAAEPAKPDPGGHSGPHSEAATERPPVAADPAVASKTNEDPLGRAAGERPAGLAGTEAPRPHEEEDDTSKPGTVTAEAKPAKGSPPEDKPSPAAPAAPPAGQAEGSSAPAQAAEKPAEETPAQDRPAPVPTRPTPDKPAAFTAPSPALAQRHTSKIAKPAEPKSRLSRHAKGSGGERCRAAGAEVALPGWYVVKTGDTLWAIAERHYGAGARYRTIFLANRERLRRGPDVIMPCQQLYLPRQRRRGS